MQSAEQISLKKKFVFSLLAIFAWANVNFAEAQQAEKGLEPSVFYVGS